MTSQAKRAVAIGGGVLVIAAGAFFLLTNRDVASKIPGLKEVVAPARCPLTGVEPKNEELIERPAVAIKVENNSVAYPLSGLEDAEVVIEEPVEGGLTRFLAVFHCTDSTRVGPVRSARIVDPAIVSPYTRILAAAGGNQIVRDALDEAELIVLDENTSGTAMFRADRPGIAMEHTLYGNSKKLRKLGMKKYEDAPAELFEFGDLPDGSKKARSISITLSAFALVTYEWDGDAWKRFDAGEPLVAESGEQIAVDNVIIEEHTVNNSDRLGDILGTPSPEIEDVTGSGKALLFRDGRVFVGKWVRDSETDPITFETKKGDTMVLHEGTTWIEIVPDQKGDVKGSFTYEK